MSGFELQPGEAELGTWTLNYVPPAGGRYLGKLAVTNQRLLFDAQFDTSLTGVLGELFITSGSHGYLSIPKAKIEHTEVKRGFFKKKVIVTVAGKDHVFDYGMLSVAKLASAIEGR
ncbi:MAG: hypothetical protein KC464_04225 [Myxococcales bacterium]|nr:hypothetical protein [Myxococcales bacterium]